jgi:hypothetical protein
LASAVGRVLDFHALRHYAEFGVTQRNLTFKLYVHSNAARLKKAVASLPDLTRPEQKHEESLDAAATAGA